MNPLRQTLRCDGCRISSEDIKTYRTGLRLCDECAREKIRIPSAQPNVFFCDEHRRQKAMVFCKSHNICICRECISQHTADCFVVNLDSEVSEREKQLTALIEQGKERFADFKTFNARVDHQALRVKGRLEGIRDEICRATAEAKEQVEEKREIETADINREADSEVQAIERKRREQLSCIECGAKQKLDKIQERERELLAKLDQVQAIFSKKTDELKSYFEEFRNAIKEAENFSQEMTLRQQFHDVSLSLTKGISRPLKMESLEPVASIAEEIKFEETLELGIGRIDIPEEKWEEQIMTKLHEVLNVKTECNKYFRMISVAGKEDVVIKNTKDGSVYVINSSSWGARKVITSRDPHDVYSCCPLDNGRIACGTRFGDVVVFDSSWNCLKEIKVNNRFSFQELPYTYGSRVRPISVAMGRDNTILAAICDEESIHVYHQDGNFLRSISTNGRRICEIHTISSGDIVVRTEAGNDTDVRLLDDETGLLRSIHRLPSEDLMSIAVDRSHGLVYVIEFVRSTEQDSDSSSDSSDSDADIEPKSRLAMMVIFPTGAATVDINFPLESTSLAEASIMPGTGELVIQRNGKLSVFKKTRPGLEERIGSI